MQAELRRRLGSTNTRRRGQRSPPSESGKPGRSPGNTINGGTMKLEFACDSLCRRPSYHGPSRS
eukprot:5924282-Pyramimonas_sp.AAC.1